MRPRRFTSSWPNNRLDAIVPHPLRCLLHRPPERALSTGERTANLRLPFFITSFCNLGKAGLLPQRPTVDNTDNRRKMGRCSHHDSSSRSASPLLQAEDLYFAQYNANRRRSVDTGGLALALRDDGSTERTSGKGWGGWDDPQQAAIP